MRSRELEHASRDQAAAAAAGSRKSFDAAACRHELMAVRGGPGMVPLRQASVAAGCRGLELEPV